MLVDGEIKVVMMKRMCCSEGSHGKCTQNFVGEITENWLL
jgi:hypothetical protein